MKNNITPEQEKIIDTIHNLVCHRITHDDRFFKAIPEIDSPDFHDWIYYVDYQFVEYDDSRVRAVIYLNGQHYQYINMPDFLNEIYVDEIADSDVQSKIIEFGGEIYDGFEIYDPNDEIYPETVSELVEPNKVCSIVSDDSEGYDNLPF